MAKLKEVIGFMDQELDVDSVPDYSAALNGLQLENEGEVHRIASAVDASLPVIEKSIASKADLLIVHHGLFWQGAQQHVGAQYRKLKLAIDAGLAIYSSHIPLDVHPLLGNNACLANRIGLMSVRTYHLWKGIELGLSGHVDCSYEELLKRVKEATQSPVHHCPGRKSSDPGRVGVITGGAGSQIAEMAAEGIETFITGEGPHWSYPLAEELGVNLVYAGHYATETFGVRALATLVAQKFKLETSFIDHPTGL